MPTSATERDVRMTAPYRIGDRVSTEKWDAFARPSHMLHGGFVTSVHEETDCQSGWMVTITCGNGEIRTLDADWLDSISSEEPM